jgi:hypothetical protein
LADLSSFAAVSRFVPFVGVVFSNSFTEKCFVMNIEIKVSEGLCINKNDDLPCMYVNQGKNRLAR